MNQRLLANRSTGQRSPNRATDRFTEPPKLFLCVIDLLHCILIYFAAYFAWVVINYNCLREKKQGTNKLTSCAINSGQSEALRKMQLAIVNTPQFTSCFWGIKTPRRQQVIYVYTSTLNSFYSTLWMFSQYIKQSINPRRAYNASSLEGSWQ